MKKLGFGALLVAISFSALPAQAVEMCPRVKTCEEAGQVCTMNKQLGRPSAPDCAAAVRSCNANNGIWSGTVACQVQNFASRSVKVRAKGK